ncbi:MAG: flagellar hook-associated protein FlgL [Planctomycetota bacterium]
MRISTESIYRRFLGGLQNATNRMIVAQEQVATGRRILRPSDDASAAARVLTLQRELADAERLRESTTFARTFVDASSGALEEGSGLLTEARAVIIQAMNGTLDQETRESLGRQIDLMRQQMLDIANRKSADRYLFSGTETGLEPWSTSVVDGIERAGYAGNGDQQRLRIGNGAEIELNVAGTAIFGAEEATTPSFSGLTGLAGGTTASQGLSWDNLLVSQTGLDLGNLASVGVGRTAGVDSTLLQSRGVTIDGTNDTVQLGNGPPVPIPEAGSPQSASVRVVDQFGAEVTLDFSTWTGVDYSGSLTGEGEISINGGPPVALDFNQQDQRLVSASGETILHLDLTNVQRAGAEVVQFDGRINLFDVLAGIASDLENADGLSQVEVTDRLEQRLGELDRHTDNLRVSLGVLGSRSGRLENTARRFDLVALQVEGLISETQDADITEAILDLQQAENTLQLSQAAGTRLIQRSLLEFIR